MLKISENIFNLKVSFAHLFLFAMFFFSGWQHAFGQSMNAHQEIKGAYQDILKLKLKSGRQQLEELSEEHKKSSHYFYVKNVADVLELLVTQNESLYKRYNNHEDSYLKGLKYSDDQNPYKLFYEAEIKLQWALVKTLFGEEIRAGLSIRSAHHTIQKNKKLFPDFVPNNKTIGLLHILLSTLPENSAWVFNLFGIKGDLQNGLSEIERISSRSPYYVEAQLIKLLAYINILNKEKEVLHLFKTLQEEHSDNLLLNYLHNSALMKYGRSEEALTNLFKLQYNNNNYLLWDFINYKLGEIHLQKQSYIVARNYYSQFLNNYKGKDLVKDAWFKIFLTYWLTDDKAMADVHYEKAQSSGRAFADADKNARGILNQSSYPNKLLMQLRLATDGGYFELARGIANSISENSFESKKEKTEYYYRVGRLNHKMNNTDEAVFYYLNTIKKSGSSHWYFAPNACLQTGYIYLQKNEVQKARFYFEKAITYKKHKYKSSIDRKARAALLDVD